MSIDYMYAAPAEARKGCQIPPKLVLQMAVSSYGMLGTKPGSNGRVASALICSATPPAPDLIIFNDSDIAVYE